MEKDKIVVGLDIGTTKICAIVGKKNEYGKLEILGMGKAVSEGVTQGIVINIDKTVDAIRAAITEAENQSGINIKEVNVGIAGQHIKSARHHGGITRANGEEEITLQDIQRLTNDMWKTVVLPGNQIIHAMPIDYTVDYLDGIKEPVGMVGTRLEADFHIITAQVMAINNINKCIKKAGLDIVNLILEPLASSMSVLSAEEKEAGVALIDIGGGTTDLAIFYDGILRHTSVIPFGGNSISYDIKEGLGVLPYQAESLKVKFGKALYSEAEPNARVCITGINSRPSKEISVQSLAHIIQCRMEEIIDLVYNEIRFSGYENKLSAGIVLTGGGARLPHLSHLTEYKTGRDTKIGYPNEHLGKGNSENVKSPMHATGVGLVLAGYYMLDDRENKLLERAETEKNHTSQGNSKSEISKKPFSFSGSDFLNSVFLTTKKLLIDDFDDKSNYK